MRVGQKNKLTYRWAIKGSRPRAIHDQRTQSTYVFGAVCPELGTGAALVLPPSPPPPKNPPEAYRCRGSLNRSRRLRKMNIVNCDYSAAGSLF
jgi:hypothetical protein